MKKISLLIFIFLFSFAFVYSAENKESEITSIKYLWNLSYNTEIEINWKNLDKCHKLYIDRNYISIKSKNNNKFTFLFSEVWKYNWTVNLECNEKIIKSSYLFPHINKITWINDNNSSKSITISWENFWTSPNVKVEWGSFKKNISQNNIILWEIPLTISDKKIYIETGWLKSNIIELDIKIPKIKFIYSKNNFFKNTEIIIYWENLNYYNKTKIQFWSDEITKFKYNKSEKSISFFSDLKIWKKNVKIISNWFESNSLDVHIIWDKPIIKNIYEKTITEDINWKLINKDILVITWKNFSQDIENIKLYKDNSILSIYKLMSNKIYISNYSLKWWNNFFKLDINWKHSNIFNVKKYYDLPSISWLELWKIENNKRDVLVYLNNFNENNDKIFFNNSVIRPVWCTYNMCRVQIPKTSLKWSFTAWKWNDKNINYKKFDISYENLPFINYIDIKWDLKQWTKVEIIWYNFFDSNITISNLFDKNNNWKIEMEVSNNKIEWRIPLSYKEKSNSSISINKYWKSAKLSFLWKDLVWWKIYWSPIIKELVSNSKDGLFKNWWIINITWNWFKNWDSIIIWNSKTSFEVKNYINWTFIIPSILKEWKYNILIENKQWYKSNSKEIIIVPKDFKPNILITKENINKNNFYIGELNNDTIYDLNILNKIDNLVIKNISFKVDNYKKEDYLWTFKLKIWTKEVSTSLISDDWIITFSWKFELPKNINETKISLIKDSTYLNNKGFKVNFLKDDFKVINSSTQKKFEGIIFSDFDSNEILLLEKLNINCIDSFKNDFNCNEFLSNLKRLEISDKGNQNNEKFETK